MFTSSSTEVFESVSEKLQEIDQEEKRKKEEKNVKKRENLVQELFTTEKTYIDCLDYLNSFFIEGFRKDMEKNKSITKEEYDYLFSQIIFIIGVNNKLFESIGKKEDIGEAFLKFGPFLLGYSNYVNKYNQIKIKLKEKKFSTIIQTLNSSRKPGSTNFESHMILPIQRIPRYILLLTGILECTPTESKDYDKLDQALSLIKKVMETIETKSKENDKKEKVKEFSKLILNCPIQLIDPHRNYVYDEEISYFDGKQIIKGSLILFSDMLMMIDEKNTYVFDVSLNVLPEVQIIKDPEELCKFGIISSLNKNYLFEALSSASKVKWIDFIETEISQQQFLSDKHIIEISLNLPSTFALTKKIGEVGVNRKSLDVLEELVTAEKEEKDIAEIQSGGFLSNLTGINNNIKRRSRKSLDLSSLFKKKE